MSVPSFTPREVVSELDRYVVGQHRAKRAVAIALRNRWRRQQVPEELRDEIAPKNIIMVGPTGVGKTEIARRIAKLSRAPFVKVEASKFTEVGYVGRDVESMVRDLVELSVQLVRAEETEEVKVRAAEVAEERLVKLILTTRNPQAQASGPLGQQRLGPFLVTPPPPSPSGTTGASFEGDAASVRADLRRGLLEDEEVEFDAADTKNPLLGLFGGQGMEEMGVNLGEMLSQLPGMKGRTRRRRVPVREARPLIEAEEAEKLIDTDRVQREAVARAEQTGIVFLDEIDKIAGGRGQAQGPDVSREGVQRDLLPIVEGSTVNTKYGPVKTDHILFIAAGAFHVSKVSDLIPELQGRFPIRVELDSLSTADFVRILTEPRNALTVQYRALLATEGVKLEFSEGALTAIAEYAAEANERAENIGARRLHTILEALLEELLYTASERAETSVTIDENTVRQTLEKIWSNEELARYIL